MIECLCQIIHHMYHAQSTCLSYSMNESASQRYCWFLLVCVQRVPLIGMSNVDGPTQKIALIAALCWCRLPDSVRTFFVSQQCRSTFSPFKHLPLAIGSNEIHIFYTDTARTSSFVNHLVNEHALLIIAPFKAIMKVSRTRHEPEL